MTKSFRLARSLGLAAVCLTTKGLAYGQTPPPLPPTLSPDSPRPPDVTVSPGLFDEPIALDDVLVQVQAGSPLRVTVPDFHFAFKGNLYDQARSAIEAERYDRAIDQLKELIHQFAGRADAAQNKVDAAHYWKAYSELKMQAFDEALRTLRDMQKQFADSRWLKDARALEVEVRQLSGQTVSPDAEADEDLKLLALRGLMQTDPERAFPKIEQVLSGNSSVRIKERALFVVAQNRSPRAVSIVTNVARNGANPELQTRAIRYLGAMRSDESAQVLGDVYRASTDEAVKRAVIQSLGGWQAFRTVTNTFKGGKPTDLQKAGTRSGSAAGSEKTDEILRSLYLSESNRELRREIIGMLSVPRNASMLVALARSEKDPALKKRIVTELSTMDSKEATDYMLELLK